MRDPLKAKARKRRYLERLKIAKYGHAAAGVDMRGRHGRHATGDSNARWNLGRIVSSEGYVLVRVHPNHPRSFGPPKLKRFKYAYEHDIVMESVIGRSLKPNEVVHHKNGDRSDNKPENLVLELRADHAREHVSSQNTRDEKGRFNSNPRHRAGADPAEWPADLRVQQFPVLR